VLLLRDARETRERDETRRDETRERERRKRDLFQKFEKHKINKEFNTFLFQVLNGIEERFDESQMLGFQGLEVENVFVDEFLDLLLCRFQESVPSVTLEDLLITQDFKLRLKFEPFVHIFFVPVLE